jgi:hypothetical protein
MSFLMALTPLQGSHEALTTADANPLALSAARYIWRPAGASDARPRHAQRALITLEGGAMRYTLDGTAPAAAVGHLMADTAPPLELLGYDAIVAFRFARAAAANITIRVTYFGA